MTFKKKVTNNKEDTSSKDFDITDELCYAVAEAVMNREDIVKAISVTLRCTNVRAIELQKKVLSSPRYQEIFEEYKNMMKSTVYQDDQDTIMIQYNNLIRKATQEKKYEVVVRILDKIRMLQSIGDKEMEFKMTFAFEPKPETNLKIIDNSLDNNSK